MWQLVVDPSTVGQQFDLRNGTTTKSKRSPKVAQGSCSISPWRPFPLFQDEMHWVSRVDGFARSL